MKRLSFALILAISIHAGFFLIKTDTSHKPEILPKSEPIKIKMTFRKKVKPQKIEPRKKQPQKIVQNQKSQKNSIEQLETKKEKPEFKEVKPSPVVTKTEAKIKQKQVLKKRINSDLVQKRVKKFKTAKKPERKIEPEQEIKPQFKQEQILREPLLASKQLIDPDQKREPDPTAGKSTAKKNTQLPRQVKPAFAVVHTKATPKYKTNPQPVYPRIAKRRGYQGRVLLLVVVSKSGTVKKLSVSKSSRHDILDKAACKAVKQWHFHPGTRDGKPVEMSVTIPIRFDLQQ